MARVTFDSVFTRYEDGSLEPMQKIRIGGVSLGPGVRFSRGTSFAGVDLALFIGRDLDVEKENDVLVIKGIYK